MKYMFANMPKVAKEFASKTKSIASLPNRSKKALQALKKK